MEIAEAKIVVAGKVSCPRAIAKTGKPVVVKIEGMADPGERQNWADLVIHYPAEAHRLLDKAQELADSAIHAEIDQTGVIGQWQQRCIDAKGEMLSLNQTKPTYFEFAMPLLLH